MLTRQEYLDLVDTARAQYERLVDVCCHSTGVEAVFVVTLDVYRAILAYEETHREFGYCYDPQRMITCGLLYGVKIFVVNEQAPNTLFSAALYRSQEGYFVFAGLEENDFLIDKGHLYRLKLKSRSRKFVDTGLPVLDGICTIDTFQIPASNSCSDLLFNVESGALKVAVDRARIVNHDDQWIVEVDMSGAIPHTDVQNDKEEKQLSAEDTKPLDDFLKSFYRQETTARGGG